jgi:ribokinase
MSVATLVLGSVNVDLVIRGQRLPNPGETVLGGEFLQAAGGKGANQAVAAARAATGTVAFVGGVGDDDFGTQSRAGLARERLELAGLTTFPGTSTGIALILVDAGGQNLISVASGANSRLTPDHVDALPDELLEKARVFLTSLEIPLPTVRRGLERARERGLITILNPAPADRAILEGDLLSLVDILTPNETELCQLAGESLEPPPPGVGAAPPGVADVPSRWRAAAVKLRNRGCRTVIATLGSAGCLVVGDVEFRQAAPVVQAVDATAAGDAFNGALAVALAEGQPLTSAVRFATATAALSVTRAGAQPSLPRREEIEQRLSHGMAQPTEGVENG